VKTPLRLSQFSFWRDDFLSAYGAVQGLDQRLNFGEFAACAFGLVAIKKERPAP
jgi:hypothetical protein